MVTAAGQLTQALAGWLLQAVGEELAAGQAGPVGTQLLAPGAGPPPADWCCRHTGPDGTDGEGMAWVRLVRRYPSTRFPAPDTTPARCGASWAVDVELGVYRCAHTLDDQGNPPTAAEMTADALMVNDDAHSLLRAACRVRWPYVIGAWTPLGPSGGCVGGAQLLAVALSSGPIGKERT